MPPETLEAGVLSAERLRSLARRIDVELTPEAGAALAAYAGLLQRWNRVHNLTAIRDERDLLTHHLLDSLAIVRPLEQAVDATPGTIARPVRLLDAGSGAGLPGIPLALAMPHWSATLVDAVQKKCAFLRQVQLELRLGNVRVLHARLEALASGDGEPPYDLVVARAFGSLRDLVERTRQVLRPGGLWAVMKGLPPDDELAALPFGIEPVAISKLRVPLLPEQRHLVLLRAGAQDAARRDGAPRES